MPAVKEAVPVLLSVDEGIAEIRFQRPEVLNAINHELACAFRDAVEAAVADEAVRVIVISGAGRAFSSGGDLDYFLGAGERVPEAARQLICPVHAAIAKLRSARQPVLASLQGAIHGAGMSLALVADLAIAAEDLVLNFAYTKVGATPDCLISWTLPRIVGLRKALEIALICKDIGADEALRLGLVNRVVPLERLEQETGKIARRLASGPPLALQGIKRLLNESLDNSLQAQLDTEEVAFIRNASARDFREGLLAFFEERAPKFEGH